jgi:hypothetical protein
MAQAAEAPQMNLRDKYNHAIQTAKGFRMDGSAEERDGKLYFTGMVKTQDEVNKIWDAIKTVPDWRNDVVAEVKIDPNAKQETTYTVKSGDTLSKIARRQQGPAFRSGQDQAGAGAEDALRVTNTHPARIHLDRQVNPASVPYERENADVVAVRARRADCVRGMDGHARRGVRRAP